MFALLARRSALLALYFVTPTAIAETHRAVIQGEMYTHIAYAKKDFKAGNIHKAEAHLSFILPDKPLVLKLDFSKPHHNTEAECKEAAQKALSMWRGALKEDDFVVSNTAEKPDFVVHFVDNLNREGHDLAGLVKWTRSVYYYSDGSATPETEGDIWIRTLRPDGDGAMSVNHMRSAMAHELGHVLGLEDSPYLGDLMGEMDMSHPVDQIGPHEVEAVLHIRSQVEQLLFSVNPQYVHVAPRIE